MAPPSWCYIFIAPVVAVVAVAVAVLMDANNFLGEWKLSAYEWDTRPCSLLAADQLRGGEDLAMWRDGIALVSAGDLGKAFLQDPANVENTGVFAVDLRAAPHPVVRQVVLRNRPDSASKFVGHGMFLSNASSRVYFVTHGDYATAASFVEIYSIHGTDFHSLGLQHESRVASSLFPAAGINDVVEGWGPHEIFVSVWRRYPQSADQPTGAEHSANHQYMTSSLLTNRYLGMRGGLGVLRCAADTNWNWECRRTAAWGLVSANGLAISPDRSLLLVGCPECSQMFQYQVNNRTGQLRSAAAPIDLPCLPDNVDWDAATGEAVVGCISVPKQLLGKTEHQAGEVISFALPQTGPVKWKPRLKSLVRHSGKLLSGVSAGIQYGGSLLVGSPWAPGLLWCKDSHTGL